MTRKTRRRLSILTSEYPITYPLDLPKVHSYTECDSKSGEVTPSSPLSPREDATPQAGDDPRDLDYINTNVPSSTSPQTSPLRRSSAKSGVDTPDRFVTHYSGPPPLSQRHLVEKLAQAELKEKENERGQRDDIRGDPAMLRVGREGHMIPSGRGLGGGDGSSSHGQTGSAIERDRGRDKEERTPRPGHGHQSHSGQGATQGQHRRGNAGGSSVRGTSTGRAEGRAKAFAFFGQVSVTFITRTRASTYP